MEDSLDTKMEKKVFELIDRVLGDKPIQAKKIVQSELARRTFAFLGEKKKNVASEVYVPKKKPQ